MKNRQANYPNSTQLAELEYIASQCFICGGDGVFLARSLYSKTEPGLIYDDDDLCYTASQPLKGPAKPKQLETAYSFRISPNPASSWLLIQLMKGREFEGKVIAFDALGRNVLEQSVSLLRTESKILDVSQMSSGLYNFQFHQDGKVIQTLKISLIK